MEVFEAQRIMESLRKGIPPEAYIRQFTVGRESEIKDLTNRLSSQDGTALLIKANYGSGKTHLLKYIREEALSQNYAVSIVTLDSNSAVRFNRMDQILGSVCRNLEIPKAIGEKGVRPFLNFITKSIDKNATKSVWKKISNNWNWDYSETLESQALFIAIRAWMTKESEVKNLVVDWLNQPWEYRTRRKVLFIKLVENLRQYFRDPRREWQFYDNDVFSFHPQEYYQSWAALRDFDLLARISGLNGLIILFDEFEDVISNMRNIAHQEAAFWNLFHFYNGKNFPGKTFYAVTPAFIEKCKIKLLEKGRWDFDFSRFDTLPTYEMSPLTPNHLFNLSLRIMETHCVAYSWQPSQKLDHASLKQIVKEASSVQIQDRARHVIIATVKALDNCMQD